MYLSGWCDFGVTGRFSNSYAFRFHAFAGGTIALYAKKSLPSNEDVLYYGFAVKGTDSSLGDNFQVELVDSTTTQVGINLALSGTSFAVQVLRGGYGGTLLAATGYDYAVDTWYHISAEFTIHNSSGTVKVWVNGSLVINLSSQDTQQTANAYANVIKLGASIPAPNISFEITDLYVGDDTGLINTSCPTEARIYTCYPVADGTLTGWSFSGTASAWQAVDDANPDDDTSYIYASVSGTKSTFTFGNLEADADSVYALQFIDYGRRDDSDVPGLTPELPER